MFIYDTYYIRYTRHIEVIFIMFLLFSQKIMCEKIIEKTFKTSQFPSN